MSEDEQEKMSENSRKTGSEDSIAPFNTAQFIPENKNNKSFENSFPLFDKLVKNLRLQLNSEITIEYVVNLVSEFLT